MEVASQARNIGVPDGSHDFPEGVPALVLAASFDMPESYAGLWPVVTILKAREATRKPH